MVTARVKSGLSALLMSEALRLASQCRSIEESEKHLDWPQPHQEDNIGHAAATVILAAASLEAAINEVYLQAVNGNVGAFPSLTVPQVALLAQLWDVLEKSRADVLRKHSVALTLAGLADMPLGEKPAQDVASLVKLRDLLVHFKPEWSDEPERHLKIEQRLESAFELNQLSARAQGRMLWFPGKCLGAGCADWACEVALKYHSEFTTRLGVASRLSAD